MFELSGSRSHVSTTAQPPSTGLDEALAAQACTQLAYFGSMQPAKLHGMARR